MDRVGVNNLVENRATDSSGEKEVAKFLDKYLYPKYYAEYSKERIFDKVRQLLGMDILVGEFVFDEKAQTTLFGCPTDTFCLEVSSDYMGGMQKGQRNAGWLYDKKKKTTHYVFVWVTEAAKGKQSKAEDFRKVDIAVVSREELIKSLARKGFTEDYVKSKDKEITDEFKSNPKKNAEHKVFHYKENLPEGAKSPWGKLEVWFTFSNNLAERPLNIICSKRYLRSIPKTKNFTITV